MIRRNGLKPAFTHEIAERETFFTGESVARITISTQDVEGDTKLIAIFIKNEITFFPQA